MQRPGLVGLGTEDGTSPHSAGSRAGTAAEAPSGQLGGLLAGSRRKGVAPAATCPCAWHGALMWWAPTPSVLAQRVSSGGNVFGCLPEEGHMDRLPPPALSPALARKPQGTGLSLLGQLPALSTGLPEGSTQWGPECLAHGHRAPRIPTGPGQEPQNQLEDKQVPSWGG